MSYTSVIAPQDLLPRLTDPAWVVIDCRFDLKSPNWGAAAFLDGHLPGAQYAHLDHDLAGQVLPGITGRHPLPKIDTMAARLAAWGIGDETQVVVYDTAGGAFAARLWWMLRWLGHPQVAVLDGGLQLWQALGYPLETGQERPRPAAFFTPHADRSSWLSSEQVDALRADPASRLIDARAPERYAGAVEPIDPVAGHIPGALNRFHGMNLTAEGRFKSPELLRSEFTALLGDTPPDQMAAYCGSGVTSCHHLLAMEYAGFGTVPLGGAKLYAGSWSEWITDGNRPIAK